MRHMEINREQSGWENARQYIQNGASPSKSHLSMASERFSYSVETETLQNLKVVGRANFSTPDWPARFCLDEFLEAVVLILRYKSNTRAQFWYTQLAPELVPRLLQVALAVIVVNSRHGALQYRMPGSTIDGFSAWVSIDGTKLPRYEVETITKKGVKTVTSWIASEAGKHCNSIINARVEYHGPATDIFYGSVHGARSCGYASRNYECRRKSSRYKDENFKFKKKSCEYKRRNYKHVHYPVGYRQDQGQDPDSEEG
ncbi:hypothetical protein BD779DRAFT_1476028 [Infundibulicybe gibba]|nr:hypothetical protein BD779DRAFT_1476028 [Infundibulicybe gibba]